MKVAYLAVGALGVDRVLEGVEDLFEGEGLVGFTVGNFPDVAVGAGADFFGERVTCEDMGLNLFSHFL